MSQPRQHLGHRVGLAPRRNGGAVDHYDWHVQLTRGGDFGMGAGAAGILGYDQMNEMRAHQRQIACDAERAAILHDLVIGKGQRRVWLINQAQQVEMLWIRCKLGQMHASDGQHDAHGRTVQRRDCAGNIRHMRPIIARFGLPWRARQRDQRHVGVGAGGHGIGAHLRGEGVGGIDHVADRVIRQVARQPLRPAKTADALWQRLSYRAQNPAGKGDGSAYPCRAQALTQRGCLGRAAQNQKVIFHG